MAATHRSAWEPKWSAPGVMGTLRNNWWHGRESYVSYIWIEHQDITGHLEPVCVQETWPSTLAAQ